MHILRPVHMRQLYEACPSSHKIWKPLPGGDHNSSVLEEGYFEAMTDFVNDVTESFEKSDGKRQF